MNKYIINIKNFWQKFPINKKIKLNIKLKIVKAFCYKSIKMRKDLKKNVKSCIICMEKCGNDFSEVYYEK
jgi:hypothetical protein